MSRSSLILGLLACSAVAASFGGCGSGATPDGGVGPPADAGAHEADQMSAVPLDLVVVNAMDKALAVLNDDDVRVCLGNTPSDRPLPDDPSHPIPLSNYPGIPLGGGVDLGPRPLPARLYVISAKEQANNYPNGSPNNPAEVACDAILGTGASAKPYLQVDVTSTGGTAQVVVLMDGTADGGATAAVAQLDDATYGPGDGGPQIHAQLGAFGPWASQPVAADLIETSDAGTSDAATPLATFDGGELSAAPGVALDVSPFDSRALRLSSTGAVPSEIVQSFQSIQSVSDPTTSASVFYGVRENFLLLALGTGGADAAAPAFGGRALHVVAIPYSP